jgi:aminoglycoside phosphotransferase (APT) family kinase protein
MERHVLTWEGRLVGLLDWGDACAADPLLEFPKLHLGLFAADRGLLAAFLGGAGWPTGQDFPRGTGHVRLARGAGTGAASRIRGCLSSGAAEPVPGGS